MRVSRGPQRSEVKRGQDKEMAEVSLLKGTCLREAKGQRELMKIDCKRTESNLQMERHKLSFTYSNAVITRAGKFYETPDIKSN